MLKSCALLNNILNVCKGSTRINNQSCHRLYCSRKVRSPSSAAASSSPILTKPHGTTPNRTEFITLDAPAIPTIVTDRARRKKQEAEEAWKELSLQFSSLPKHYLMLSKFRLTTLVVSTSMAGYALSGAPLDPVGFLACAVGTGLVSSAANSINQFLEVPFDAQMSRTKNRVLVRGTLTPLHAIGFACAASSLGIATLYMGTNATVAALGAANLVLYSFIYTPMKRISIINTWVGSIVGAIPPVMGFVACEGSIGAGAGIMAGLLYAWQFPHFNALSWNLRPDYSRAGYRMMAVTNPGLCRRVALRYTIGIAGLSVLAPVLDVTTWLFPVLSFPLNSYFIYLSYNFYKESDSGSSRKLFRFSLLHLPILMGLLLVTKKHWAFSSTSSTTAAKVETIS